MLILNKLKNLSLMLFLSILLISGCNDDANVKEDIALQLLVSNKSSDDTIAGISADISLDIEAQGTEPEVNIYDVNQQLVFTYKKWNS